MRQAGRWKVSSRRWMSCNGSRAGGTTRPSCGGDADVPEPSTLCDRPPVHPLVRQVIRIGISDVVPFPIEDASEDRRFPIEPLEIVPRGILAVAFLEVPVHEGKRLPGEVIQSD